MDVGRASLIKARTISKPTHRQIADRFTASLMSNSKWRKMFSMLGPRNADVKLEQAIVKFTDDEREHLIAAPPSESLRTPWGYIELSHFGPTALSAIEWIEFPAYATHHNSPPNGVGRVPATRIAQDLDKAEAVISKLGKYPMERTARGLRITGHVRREDSNHSANGRRA